MPVDAVIVLGGGYTQGVANLPLSSDAYKRMMWGFMVAKSNNVPLLFSGGGLNREYLESDAFLDSLKEIKTILNYQLQHLKALIAKSFLCILKIKASIPIKMLNLVTSL